MTKYDRKVIQILAPMAEKVLEDYSDYTIVAVNPLNNRLVVILEKERGPGRPPKKDNGKDE